MIDLAGNARTCPTLHQLEGKGASGATLVVGIPLMVKHAAEGLQWPGQ